MADRGHAIATGQGGSKGKRTEDVLQQSLHLLQSVAEHAPCSIWMCDGDGTITFANQAALALFGVTDPSQIIGRHNIHRDTTEAEKPLLDGFKRAWAGEVVRYRQDLDMTTVKYDTKRRGTLHLQSTLFAIPAASGRRPNIVVMQEDISELVRAREALRESEERFRRLSEAALEGIIIHDNGRILDANEQYATMLGYDIAEVVGMHVLDFTAPESRDLVSRNIELEYEDPYEHFALRKDGSVLPVEARGKSIPYEGRTARVTAVRDITERRRAEEALQAEREHLEARVEHQMVRRNPYGLTFRELTVLHLVAAGRSDKEIGAELGISPLTAQKHISNILTKMKASSRTEAGVRAVRDGLLE